MKRIYRINDKVGGFIEVQILKRNNEVPEDLIWLHVGSVSKKGKEKILEENGISMKPMEAHKIICGLHIALDYIIDEYKLEKFKVK